VLLYRVKPKEKRHGKEGLEKIFVEFNISPHNKW
jgi:hypothetical protein